MLDAHTHARAKRIHTAIIYLYRNPTRLDTPEEEVTSCCHGQQVCLCVNSLTDRQRRKEYIGVLCVLAWKLQTEMDSWILIHLSVNCVFTGPLDKSTFSKSGCLFI